ncbi:MAG: O-antigen ligase family protein, partial [Pyrinomonadaceae bacterium]|nr:O-antigen ligase family protein [Pyrinomonadaceae bacterium]
EPISAFAIIAFLLGTVTIIDLITNQNLQGSGIGAFRIRYGKYAEILATLTPFLLGLTLQVKKKRPLIILITSGCVAFLGTFASLSKGAAISCILGLTVFLVGVFVFSLRAYRRFAVILLTITTILLLMSQSLFPLTTTQYSTSESLRTSDTSSARIFYWNIALQMIRENSLIGVGADNFWIKFNDARISFNEQQESLQKQPAESYFVQRAHNEILQITAELGLIGLLFFILPFAWLTKEIIRAFAVKKRFSPSVWGSIGGLLAFFASSMVSSFSFRFLASGITFFFLVAFLVNKLSKTHRKKTTNELIIQPQLTAKLLPLALFCLIITASANAGNFLIKYGEEAKDLRKAEHLLTLGAKLNPSNPTSYFSLGLKYYSEKRFKEASSLFEKAISNGFDVDISRFYLASSYRATGDLAEEEKVLRQALKVFPGSVFLRIRLYLNLTDQKKPQAQEELEKALSIDEAQSRGWLALFTLGASEAGRQAMNKHEFLPPAELEPTTAVYSVIHEQEVLELFPRRIE